MAILGTLLKKGIILRESIEQQYTSSIDLQKQELRKLLIQAEETLFGRAYHFKDILQAFKSKSHEDFYTSFQRNIPVHDYNKIYSDWWHLSREGKANVCWPGRIKYFALSSGTSGSSSKHIPITKDMLKSIRKTSVRQLLTLSKYDLSTSLYTKGILMLGGSTNLRKNGTYFEGDLSGITTSQIPFWFQHFYKPGKRIARTGWDSKLDEITKKAANWDMGIIVGVPAWLQILMEKIIDHHQIENIHEIWPNLGIFVHGGVSFEPYKKGFEKMLGKPLIYMETYLASEGFLAFQARADVKGMKLVLNNGIFYEFVPFTQNNFTEDGDIRPNPETLKIDEVEEGREYAILISTNAGCWRYLIGDVIKFTSLEECEVVITGRTKLFLSLCGEHMSLDNINRAVELASKNLNIDIREFTVLGEPKDMLFAHHWYIGTDDEVAGEDLTTRLDGYLKELNDDYKVERTAALKEIKVQVLPTSVFLRWMELQGKVGGSNKFPRVLKKDKAQAWKDYLRDQNLLLV